MKIYRLTSGEEIIGSVESKTDTSITIESPAAIIMQPSEKGVQMGLMPFMAYADGKKVTFHTSQITAECDAETPLVNEYSRIFGSGIQIANANDKLLKG